MDLKNKGLKVKRLKRNLNFCPKLSHKEQMPKAVSAEYPTMDLI